MGRIQSGALEKDLNTIIKEQCPDTTMPQAIDIYVEQWQTVASSHLEPIQN